MRIGQTGFNNAVTDLLAVGSSLFVAGNFTLYGITSVPRLAKLDLLTGVLDATFPRATGLNSAVSALATSGSSLYVGGGFTTYRSATVQGLAKIDLTSGNLDTAFSQTSGFAGGSVRALSVSGSSIFVGGSFTLYRSASIQRLAKLNLTTGVLDTTFTLASGVENGQVTSLAISSSSLFAGGDFRSYRGNRANNILKLDQVTGTMDGKFTAVGTNHSVNSLIASDSKLYVGGIFETVGGIPVENLAKINLTTGLVDTEFSLPSGISSTPGFTTAVYSLAVSGTSVYVGGNFSLYRGQPALFLAKLDSVTGALDTNFTLPSSGFDNYVHALAIAGSSLYVGGQFSTYRGLSWQSLVKLDSASGVVDPVFSSAGPFDASVSALAVSGTSLFVGGSFYFYGADGAEGVAKVDLTTGILDTTFTQASGFDGNVQTLLVSGSNIFVGGYFSYYRGVNPAYSLAKLDLTNGNIDTNFTKTISGGVIIQALAESGSSLYVGGLFSSYDGQAVSRLAKIDKVTGALDTSFTQGTGFESEPTCLVVHENSLYVGGNFKTYRDSPAPFLSRLDLGSGSLK
jgi:hypothetical protein